ARGVVRGEPAVAAVRVPVRAARTRDVAVAVARRPGLGPAPLPEEDEEVLPTHVVGGEQRGDRADRPERGGDRPRILEHLTFRPNPAERRYPGDREPSDEEGHRRDG